MISSMTGYGKAEKESDLFSCTLEIRSVNSRYLEIVSKLPQAILYLESDIKKKVKSYIKRGRIDLSLKVSYEEKNKTLEVDKEKADILLSSLNDLRNHLKLPDEIRLRDIINCEGKLGNVFVQKEPLDIEAVLTKDLIMDLISCALENLNSMKLAEGDMLEIDIRQRLDKIHAFLTTIEEKAKTVPLQYKEKLKLRLANLAEDMIDNFNEVRILHEIAIFADKSDISEEITRLHSHITQFNNIIDETVSGKKLDFLLQEMNREANTIGSKANNSEIAHHVVDLKCEMEKIREMVQNIE